MASLDDTAALWRPSLTLDGGADQWARLVGEVVVSIEEGAAKVARWERLPEAGAVDPTAWVGAAVDLDFVRVDAAGAELARWDLFTGRVNRPTYDPNAARAGFEATDGLQETVDATARATLDATIGGQWSADVFPEVADNWEYAQQRLETVPASLQLDGAGALQLTAWAAGTVDLTVTQTDLVDDGDVGLALAERDGLVNEVDLSVDYRYETIRHRETGRAWNYGRAFCDYLSESSTLPSIGMIRQAADGTGWKVRREEYDRLPVTGIYNCFAPPDDEDVSWVNELPELVTRAQLTLVTQWTQTITEAYSLTVTAPESVGAVGTISVEDSAAADVDYDWEAFEADDQEPDTSADPDACGPEIEERETLRVATTVAGVETLRGADDRFVPPAGAATDAWGDYVLAQSDDARRTAAIETALARARVKILESHRRNRVTFTTVLRPDISLASTVRLNADRIQATGKVVAIEHRLDLRRQRHTSTITIAVSRRYGTGAAPAEDPLTAPASPSPTPPVAAVQPWAGASVGTQLGGITGAPVHDPCLQGYSGNYMTVSAYSVISGTDADGDGVFVPRQEATEYLEPTAEIYPTQFRLTVDAVESAVRDAYEASQAASYTVAIPDDELVLTAP